MAVVPTLALVKNADGHDEVATRVKPSASTIWDMPSNSIVELMDEWVECDYKGHHGFIKTKNLLGATDAAVPGTMLEVKDSYPGNKATCMRRHAEQDASKGNVLCYVPNGPGAVKLKERWVECKWRGTRGFVKSRHVKPAPAGATAAAPLVGGPVFSGRLDPFSALPARGAPASSSSGAAAAVEPKPIADEDGALDEEPPAKKAKVGKRQRCKFADKCYRQNPIHKVAFCHPGDPDWDAAGEEKDAAPAAIAAAAPAVDAMVVDADAAPKEAAPEAAAAETEAPPPTAGEPDPSDKADEGAPPAETKAAAEVPSVGEASAGAGVPAPAADGPAAVAEPALPAGPEEAAAPAMAVPAPAAPAAPVAPAAVAAAPADAAGPGEETRDCDCCFDSVAVKTGMPCPGGGHFFCAGCLANLLIAFKTADYADQKKGKGRVLCPMKDSDTPFGDGGLVSFVPQEVFDEYLQIRIKVAEKGIQEQIEKEHSGKIDELKEKLAKATGASEQLELDKHRLRIIDDIFTLKCPRCKLAFLDYDNCSAVTCGGCKCGFCSFCLEDCGKDAHGHFYKNGSKCPTEGGPLFVEHAQWCVYQNKRKEKLLCEYLAAVPEEMRKKVADLCSPDAKDLGVKMPEDLSGAALDPEAHGISRVKIQVPRSLRARMAAPKMKAWFDKAGVTLKLPDPKTGIRVSLAGIAMTVPARKTPTMPVNKKNLVQHLADGHEVKIDDEWVECQCPKEKIPNGFVKRKHVKGWPQCGSKAVIEDAGGHGSVLVRKEAKQDEGKNSLGFLSDGTEVKVIRHWVECIWDGKRAFLESANLPEDDIILQGPIDDCWAAATHVEKEVGVPVFAKALGGKAKGAGRGKGKGKGKGGRG